MVRKCCVTHCQGNYTNDKQVKVSRLYQKISKKESFGYQLFQEITY